MNKFKVNQLRNAAISYCGENVAVFMDYDNVYYGFRDYALVSEEDCKVVDLIWEIYGTDKIRTIRAFADFDQLEIKLRTLQTNRVQIRQVYGNGREEKNRKNASDIELSLDAIETCYKDDFDTYVIVTADSDMIPIMSRLMFKGKKVHLYYLEENTSQYQDIKQYAHFKCDLISFFNIDKRRKEPNYWFSMVEKHIEEWYKDSRNNGKLYGTTWLIDGLKKEFNMSSKLISNVIEQMENSKRIMKVKNIKKSIEGYITVGMRKTFLEVDFPEVIKKAS